MRESVQDAASRCRLKERHGWSQDVLEHVEVHDARGSHGADCHIDGVDKHESNWNRSTTIKSDLKAASTGQLQPTLAWMQLKQVNYHQVWPEGSLNRSTTTNSGLNATETGQLPSTLNWRQLKQVNYNQLWPECNWNRSTTINSELKAA